jgi:histidinol dehydrogenase
MTIVATKIAGIPEIVVRTPPPVNPLTLEIYDIVDIDEVYQIGEILAIPKTDSAKQRHDQ